MPTRLMIPGPVSVEFEVLHELGSPVQAHYGPEWTAIYNETRELLRQVFQTQGDIHILVGSGSAGLDAAIGSMTSPGDLVVIGQNGFFGQRLVEIGRNYGLEVVVVDASPGQPLDPDEMKAALMRNPSAAAVAVVHLETSTTVINPIAEIAEIAYGQDVPVIVDAVSSLAGVPLAMDEWHIDICVGASQKCLGSPPGLAPVAISPRAWQAMASRSNHAHGWYLNLETWRRYEQEWGQWHPFPVTMATNNVMALRAGLQRLFAEGLEIRFERYRELAQRLREGIRRLGLRPFTPDAQMAPILTAVCCPEGVSSGEVVRFLLEEHDIKIAGGLGPELRDRIFRIGHMGATVGKEDIDAVIDGLADFLQRR